MQILKTIMKKLIIAFKARSKAHLVLIFLIFGLSGILSISASDIVLDFLGLVQNTTNALIYWPTRLVTLFLVYQLILLLVSACFGEFRHFSKYSLKLIKRLKFQSSLNRLFIVLSKYLPSGLSQSLFLLQQSLQVYASNKNSFKEFFFQMFCL